MCPTIDAPMQTGDGLLARIAATESMALDTFDELCAAAAIYGNGVIEVTQRGSVQVRGLSEESAPVFAQHIGSIGIAAHAGPALLTSPLFGLDAAESFDPTAVVPSLRAALQARRVKLASLGPKVSISVDGGGKLHLDRVPADIRLAATSNSLFQLSLAGEASTASLVGYVSMNRVAASVADLLQLIASRGPTARARDLIAGLRLGPMPADPRTPSEPIGIHPLKDGTVALGLALPFGHTLAGPLRRLVRAAGENGAKLLRPAPGRTLLAIGLAHAGADKLREFATGEGFVVDSRDPRLRVVACAGTPACASAKLPTRQLAPAVAHAARSLVGASNVVHLSGCAKGCAHPGPAAITIVGPDRIIVNGRASDTPRATTSSAGIVADIERLCSRLDHV